LQKKIRHHRVGDQKFWLPKGLAIETIWSLYPMVIENNLITICYGNRKKTSIAKGYDDQIYQLPQGLQ
jgi:hypothetical protein